MADNGKVRLTKNILSTGSPITWRSEGDSSWQRQQFGFISRHKRRETGLCSLPYPLQHGIRCQSSRRFTRQWRWHPTEVQNRWRSVQPQMTQRKGKGEGSHTERTPLCGWLRLTATLKWKCNSAWITYLELATTLVLPSAPRRRKSCTSLHHERCITSHTSLWMTSHWKLPILFPTWEALSPEKPTLAWKSITYFPKPTLHLEDSGRKCGTDEESAKRPS